MVDGCERSRSRCSAPEREPSRSAEQVDKGRDAPWAFPSAVRMQGGAGTLAWKRQTNVGAPASAIQEDRNRLPPCCSTRFWAIVRPIPRAPSFVENMGLKIRLAIALLIPGPLSDTVSSQSPPERARESRWLGLSGPHHPVEGILNQDVQNSPEALGVHVDADKAVSYRGDRKLRGA